MPTYKLPEVVASFHVVAQNAGVLVRKVDDSVIFELFELSPTNASVFNARGRLIRQFPAAALSIPRAIFAQAGFQSVFAKTLVKMSLQPVSGTKEKVVKARQEHDEERNTTDPRMVTEFLASFLQGLGEPVNTTGIRKNTREEVVWSDAKLPWRRSALWLLIRVSLQLTMARISDNSKSPYKPFMVFLLTRVLGAVDGRKGPSDVLHVMTTKICRRLKKLNDPLNGKWLETVARVVSEASSCIAQRWETIQHHCELQPDLAAISKLEMEEDNRIPLKIVDAFIVSISRRNDHDKSTFRPKAGVRPLDAHTLPRVHANTKRLTFPSILP